VLDGQATVEEAIAADAQRNAAFAKRQRTWFRAEPDIEWLDATDSRAADRAALDRACRLLDVAG
jgi:tRNA dimethylallyltransferase